MPLWPAFCGGFYQALSPVIAADTAINVYTETRTVPGSPKQVTMYGTPGLHQRVTAGTVCCRGWFTQDGLTLVVVGSTLYSVDPVAESVTSIGTVANDGSPVSFASNGLGGDQIGIVGGGQLKVYDTSTSTLSAAIALPFSNPVMITFLDGYGLINEADSPRVWFSALEDLTSWDPLDFFARSGTSDNLVGILVSRDRLWCWGSKTTTLFYDSGDVDTPFLPYPGTSMQTGLTSPWLLGVYNDVVYAVAESSNGSQRMIRATEPQPETISTPPVEAFFGRCSTLSDARLLIYEQDGHLFVTVTCPSASDDVQSYSFDAGEGLWHARAGWDATTGRYVRWRAQGSVSVNGQVWVGDFETGDLYTLDLDVYDDNGVIIRRERTAPYLGAENDWVFVNQFELGMQAGVGLDAGQGSAPVATLEISRDGARTWVDAGTGSLGASGQYTERATWRHLGRARADRLACRVTQTDPVKCVWGPGAWLRLSSGTGQT